MTCGTPTPATTRVVQIAPGPDPDLDRVGAGVDQRLGGLGGRDVAGDDLDVEALLDQRATISSTPREWPCAVSTTSTSTLRGDQRLGALERVRADADGRADAQPALLVLRRVRELDPLLDVLDGDQALEPAVGVDDRQLLDLVAVEEPRPPRASSRPAR